MKLSEFFVYSIMIVYFHRNPVTYEIFYVGLGSIKRANAFYSYDRNTVWNRIVNKYGKPVVQIVQRNLTKEKACEWERYYIDLLGIINEGGQLCNMSYGGELSPMSNPATVKKVADKLRGKARPDMKVNNPMRKPENREIARKTMIEKIRPNITADQKNKMVEDKRTLFKKNNPQFNKLTNWKTRAHQRKRVIQMDMDGNEIIGHISITDAGKSINKSHSHIYLCCINIRKSAYGFKWKYASCQKSEYRHAPEVPKIKIKWNASLETRLKMRMAKINKPANQPVGYKHSSAIKDKISSICKEAAKTPHRIAQYEAKKRRLLMIDPKTTAVIKEFNSVSDAHIYFKAPMSGNISAMINGRRKIAFGYKWKYAS